MRAVSILASWLPPVIWAGLIFYLSSIPGLNSGLGAWDLILRKIAHMVEFGVLAVLTSRSARRTWTALAPLGVILVAGFLSLAYAISDEIHQAFVPRRGPSAGDVAFDAAGILIALWLTRNFWRPQQARVTAKAGRLAAFLAAVLILAGCGADAEFKRARGAEMKGRRYEAWQKYQGFAARHPKHKDAPEAIFRAGWLAQVTLGDCTSARAFYDRVLTDYASSDPWAARAEFHSQNCPNYFPLIRNMTWIEGDSDSGGRNARIETVCIESSGPAKLPFSEGSLSRTYFAGTSKFKTAITEYRKDGKTVWELPPEGGKPRILLKWPLAPGTRWTAEVAGRPFTYEIVSTSRSLTVGAGTFDGCLWVRSRSENIPGATNEYYAPNIGRILTTYSTASGERRNTELLSFTPGNLEQAYK